MKLFVLWTLGNWPQHERKFVRMQGRGVLDKQRARMALRLNCQSVVLNSSQGTPERTLRGKLWKERRMREIATTENSSICFLKGLCRVLRQKLGGTLLAGTLVVTGSAWGNQQEAIRRVGDQFEGMMLQHLYSQLKSGNESLMNSNEDSLFRPSNGERIFRAMQDEIVLNQLAKRRPLGMGNLVERQLNKQVGVPASARVK